MSTSPGADIRTALLATCASLRSFLGSHDAFKFIIDDQRGSQLVGYPAALLHAANMDASATTLLLEAFDSQLRRAGCGCTWLGVFAGLVLQRLLLLLHDGAPCQLVIQGLHDGLSVCAQVLLCNTVSLADAIPLQPLHLVDGFLQRCHNSLVLMDDIAALDHVMSQQSPSTRQPCGSASAIADTHASLTCGTASAVSTPAFAAVALEADALRCLALHPAQRIASCKSPHSAEDSEFDWFFEPATNRHESSGPSAPNTAAHGAVPAASPATASCDHHQLFLTIISSPSQPGGGDSHSGDACLSSNHHGRGLTEAACRSNRPSVAAHAVCACSAALGHGRSLEMQLAATALLQLLPSTEAADGVIGSAASQNMSIDALQSLSRSASDVQWQEHVAVVPLVGPPTASSSVVQGAAMLLPPAQPGLALLAEGVLPVGVAHVTRNILFMEGAVCLTLDSPAATQQQQRQQRQRPPGQVVFSTACASRPQPPAPGHARPGAAGGVEAGPRCVLGLMQQAGVHIVLATGHVSDSVAHSWASVGVLVVGALSLRSLRTAARAAGSTTFCSPLTQVTAGDVCRGVRLSMLCDITTGAMWHRPQAVHRYDRDGGRILLVQAPLLKDPPALRLAGGPRQNPASQTDAHMHGVGAGSVVTLLLRAPCADQLEALQARVQSCFEAVRGACASGRMLPGGGAFELMCANALRSGAAEVGAAAQSLPASHHSACTASMAPDARHPTLQAEVKLRRPWQLLNARVADDAILWRAALREALAACMDDMVAIVLQNAGMRYADALSCIAHGHRALARQSDGGSRHACKLGGPEVVAGALPPAAGAHPGMAFCQQWRDSLAGAGQATRASLLVFDTLEASCLGVDLPWLRKAESVCHAADGREQGHTAASDGREQGHTAASDGREQGPTAASDGREEGPTAASELMAMPILDALGSRLAAVTACESLVSLMLSVGAHVFNHDNA